MPFVLKSYCFFELLIAISFPIFFTILISAMKFSKLTSLGILHICGQQIYQKAFFYCFCQYLSFRNTFFDGFYEYLSFLNIFFHRFYHHLSFLNKFFNRFCPLEKCEVTPNCLYRYLSTLIFMNYFSMGL